MRTSAKWISWILIALIAILSLPIVSAADDHMEEAGDALQVALPLMAYGMTFAYQDPAGRNQFYRSFFTTMGITYTLKVFVEKERPNGGDASFPSGHTAAAFAGASFIQRRYGWLWGAPAYMAATFVGWNRVETENHYTEDVVAAALIATASTYFFTKPYLDKIHIMPFVSNEKFGVTIAVEW
jgi:membrane-associated phospholipid phosphatase